MTDAENARNRTVDTGASTDAGTLSILSELRTAYPTRYDYREAEVLDGVGLRRSPFDDDDDDDDDATRLAAPDTPTAPIAVVYLQLDGAVLAQRGEPWAKYADYSLEMTLLPLPNEERPGTWAPPPSDLIYEREFELMYVRSRERGWLTHALMSEYLPWQVPPLSGETVERSAFRVCVWKKSAPQQGYLELRWKSWPVVGQYVMNEEMESHEARHQRTFLDIVRGDAPKRRGRPVGSGYYSTEREFHSAVCKAYQAIRKTREQRCHSKRITKAEVYTAMPLSKQSFCTYQTLWPLPCWPPC